MQTFPNMKYSQSVVHMHTHARMHTLYNTHAHVQCIGVKEMFITQFKMGVARIAFKIDEVGPPDATDTLFERSHYTLFDTKGNIVEKGK